MLAMRHPNIRTLETLPRDSANGTDQPWLTQPYNLPFKLVDVSDKHQLATTNSVALIFEVGNFPVLSFEFVFFLLSGSFLWWGLLRSRCVPDGLPQRRELRAISSDRPPSSPSLKRDQVIGDRHVSADDQRFASKDSI